MAAEENRLLATIEDIPLLPNTSTFQEELS
jgi:hypothetical protein